MTNFFRKPFIHLLTILMAVYSVYYFGWRIACTLNYTHLFSSLVLLAAEAQGIISFLLFAMMTWNVDEKPAPAPAEGLSVDVFIPTYNEEMKILEPTIIGCINMRYKHTTYILDDGRRPEVEELARRMGCRYLTRPDNRHAKAGNINAALKNTSGDFIVVLDCDMVPQPDFLEKTLGYFNDPKTAIVQLPQEFYNLDSMQHKKGSSHWHEQQLFYHVIQPGKDNINAAFWCGSPSVVRREALDSIGGVATESITEDFLTSIKLNSKGWRIRYHHEVLAFGIAPQSFHAFSLQRLRWAQGSIGILRSRFNPLITPGLTIKQRLSHFSAIYTYFDSYQKLIYLLLPSLYLLTGILPIRLISGLDFFLHWSPYFILTLVTNIALGRGYFKYIDVEKYNTLKMVTFLKASLTLFRFKSLNFRVTPKTAENSIKQTERRELRVQFLILILVIASIIIGLVNTVWNMFFKYISVESAVVAIFWSLFNGCILFIALNDVTKRMYNRQDYRFEIELNSKLIELTGMQKDAKVNDISYSGISLTKFDAGDIENNTSIKLYLPDGVLNLPGKVVYSRVIGGTARRIGFKFDEFATEEKKRLYNYLFVTVPRNVYDSKNNSESKNELLIKAIDQRLNPDRQAFLEALGTVAAAGENDICKDNSGKP